MSDEDKRATAYHEAGHALVAMLLPESDPVHKVTIIPRGMALGVTWTMPEEDRFNLRKEQILAKITHDGVFLEQLEENPAKYLPEVSEEETAGDVVAVDLNRPMPEILAELSNYPVATRLSLTGPLIVARDIAHAKLKELLDGGGELPQYFKNHIVYYAGPAKTPEGYAKKQYER